MYCSLVLWILFSLALASSTFRCLANNFVCSKIKALQHANRLQVIPLMPLTYYNLLTCFLNISTSTYNFIVIAPSIGIFSRHILISLIIFFPAAQCIHTIIKV